MRGKGHGEPWVPPKECNKYSWLFSLKSEGQILEELQAGPMLYVPGGGAAPHRSPTPSFLCPQYTVDVGGH